MKKTSYFNLEITLNCGNCGKECQILSDPWEKLKNLHLSAGDALVEAINETYIQHQANNECRQPPVSVTLGGRQYRITEEKLWQPLLY